MTEREILEAAFQGELGEQVLLYIMRAILDSAGVLL